MPVGETILVVDDEVLIRMTLAEELADDGFFCLEAASGKDALHVLAEHPEIALLITDVGLPGGMNGPDIAAAARATRPGLPVLFITGYANHAQLEELAGRTAVMTKPVRARELIATARELLGR